MSVGHIARIFEAAGLPTVIVAALPFRGRLEPMAPPRLLVTAHPMGRVFGAPGDSHRQRRVVEAALGLLEEARRNPTVREMAGS